MRAHLNKPIVDLAGDLQSDEAVVVAILRPDSEELLPGIIYSGSTGVGFYVNPLTVTNGVLDFYLAVPTRVRLRVTVGAEDDVVYEDVDVLAPFDGATPIQLLLNSPNGVEWSITIDNSGVLHSSDQ